eukprot:6867949-Prymnesium_polylepis.1
MARETRLCPSNCSGMGTCSKEAIRRAKSQQPASQAPPRSQPPPPQCLEPAPSSPDELAEEQNEEEYDSDATQPPDSPAQSETLPPDSSRASAQPTRRAALLLPVRKCRASPRAE